MGRIAQEDFVEDADVGFEGAHDLPPLALLAAASVAVGRCYDPAAAFEGGPCGAFAFVAMLLMQCSNPETLVRQKRHINLRSSINSLK